MNLVDTTLQRVLVCAIGCMLVLGACSASAASPRKVPPDATASSACLHALDLADLLLNQTAQGAHIDSQIFAGTLSATDAAPRLTDLASAQAAVKPEYETAKAACRKSG
jgi:hypothetical protein